MSVILGNTESNNSGILTPNSVPSIDLSQVVAPIAARVAADVYERMVISQINIKCKKLHKDSIVPTYGSEKAAGADLYAYLPNGDITIESGETVMIGTGVAFELPDGFAGFIMARSGLSTKEGLRPANCVGLCDSDYHLEYKVALHNDSNTDKVVKNSQRIAQVVFMPVHQAKFDIVEELEDNGRGGFGSTGK